MTTPAPLRSEHDESLASLLVGRGRCTLLLVLLLLLLAAYPYFLGSREGRLALGLLQLVTVLSGYYAVERRGLSLYASAFLVIALVVLYVVRFLFPDGDALAVLRDTLNIAFYLLVIERLLIYLLRRGAVTADKLHAAISVYLLAAIAWAMAYGIVERMAPGSFAFGHPPAAGSPPFFHFLYFSFTTITSTGFGDVAPVTDQARSLVILEQLFGLFFITVLIARLAGLYPQSETTGR